MCPPTIHPANGLHFSDIDRLNEILHQLTAEGNTVIVIEHNFEIIKSADWIVDLGPLGGDEGGRLMGEGTLREICNIKGSLTGEYLKKQLPD